MKFPKDDESDRAAATLYRHAQANLLLRRYLESQGHEPESPEALAEWARQAGLVQPEPEHEDYEAVKRAHPDLARLANRSNPYLSGKN